MAETKQRHFLGETYGPGACPGYKERRKRKTKGKAWICLFSRDELHRYDPHSLASALLG
jgi:hypothetical protein